MIMTLFIGSLRALRVAIHLAYGFAIAFFFPHFSQTRRDRLQQRWSADLLAIFNVELSAESHTALQSLQTGIIVTNHISWLDVFVLSAIMPMRFVAKSDVRDWPMIGWLCSSVRTLYIERGKARDAARINRQIVELLQGGDCLTVFPEGTTTDGTQLAEFHASLMQPAIDAGAQIHPLALRYHDQNGVHSTAPAYIDEITFFQSFRSILACRKLHVQLVATPSIDTSKINRRTLAQCARQQISQALETLHAAPPAPARNTAHQGFQPIFSMLLTLLPKQQVAGKSD